MGDWDAADPQGRRLNVFCCVQVAFRGVLLGFLERFAPAFNHKLADNLIDLIVSEAIPKVLLGGFDFVVM
jgi:hypothetical protein